MRISQDTKDISRFGFTFLKGGSLVGGILLGFLVFIFLLGISFKSYKLFLAYYILGVFITLVIFLGLGMIVTNLILKWRSLSEVRKHINKRDPEVVVILGYDGIKIIGNLFISTYLGIGYLIKYLELKKKSFNIYVAPSKREVSNLLNNNKIKTFYLVGHGSRRGFGLNKKETIFYSDYVNSKIIKNEIHLYHCGHGEGKTLIDYIVKKENRKKCFVAHEKVMVVSYILRFYDLYKKELKRSKE